MMKGASKRMKILVGYDGSECADAALEDLKRAGLPREAEAFVLTVADVFLPPPIEEIDEVFPQYVPAGIRRAHEHAQHALHAARNMAAWAAERLRSTFPEWRVRQDACADSPAWALISKADSWKPDLIVVGANGHTSLGGRIILGSVSQRVLYEARSSVRIARDRAGKSSQTPLRIIVGVDGSSYAEAAVNTAASRTWPAGSEARLITVLDTVFSVTDVPSGPAPVIKWVDSDDEEDREWVRRVFDPLAERLRRAGVKTSIELRKGNPKHVLVEEAKEWGADSVFVGVKGLRGIEHLLMGSVSAAVAARAHCSVEVVRPA